MNGTMLVIPPDGPVHTVDFTAPIDLPSLKQAVGGYLEVVPYFHTIVVNGALQRCVAFCDEDGKRKELATNNFGCTLWQIALRRHPELKSFDLSSGPSGADYLVGPIVVVYGDDEWMAEL